MIENQQSRWVTSGFIKNRARFARVLAQNGCQNQNYSTYAGEMSISSNSDLLNSNLIVFCQLKKSLPIYNVVDEIIKRTYTVYLNDKMC